MIVTAKKHQRKLVVELTSWKKRVNVTPNVSAAFQRGSYSNASLNWTPHFLLALE